MTIEELRAAYGDNLVPIANRSDIASMKASKASCCWLAGSRIGDTGWVQLCTDRPRTFVCTIEDYEAAT